MFGAGKINCGPAGRRGCRRGGVVNLRHGLPYNTQTNYVSMMPATKKAENKKSSDKKCWEGYKRVPGTKAGEKGSCEKK
jgi:hypothetical protein